MKYIIIPTIVFNLVCLSIFISRQYKKYHTRKSNYIHYIETIKAKIIKEIENTPFYTSTDPEINISAKNILVFHFSMEACQPCLINDVVQMFSLERNPKNKNIIFFSNDIENRLRKNFLGKQITTSLKKEKIPLSKYTTPLLFTIDSNNTVQNIFIPDKDDTESLRNYLKKIKNNYFSKM